jgi:cytochrome oxidase complex assembly protein 1
MSTTDIEAPPVQVGWWRRNRNWVIPIGGGLLVIVAFVGVLMGALFVAFRSSDAYATAVTRARTSPAVVHELGEPIEVGWWVTGSLNLNRSSGSADLSLPLRGPSGRGTLYVTAAKHAGRWEYSVLEVAIEGRDERINLLGEGQPDAQRPQTARVEPRLVETRIGPGCVRLLMPRARPQRSTSRKFSGPSRHASIPNYVLIPSMNWPKRLASRPTT